MEDVMEDVEESYPSVEVENVAIEHSAAEQEGAVVKKTPKNNVVKHAKQP